MALNRWEDAIHPFTRGDDGKCTGGWYNDRAEYVPCGSSQRSSVLHDDPEAEFRQMHDHGGGDCMCFEDEYRYPDGFYGAMKKWVEGR